MRAIAQLSDNPEPDNVRKFPRPSSSLISSDIINAADIMKGDFILYHPIWDKRCEYFALYFIDKKEGNVHIVKVGKQGFAVF
jgi:competence transcription factor ComK